MRFFWQGQTVHHESVLMIARKGEIPHARLAYAPTEILSVMSTRLDAEYEAGVDWTFDNGKLRLTERSRIPCLTEEEMYPSRHVPLESMPKKGGGAVLFREGSFFHDRQIVVTYRHADKWNGPLPVYAERSLPGTIGKLRMGDPLSMVLYGDSISVGANASGYTGVPPYRPIWGQMVADELKRHYGSDISFSNPSVGGMTSSWGKDNAASLVASRRPDLTVIAFGMNDGSGTCKRDGMKPSAFKANIRSIMDTVRSDNPIAEFILVGTTLPNEETFFLDQQPYYYEALRELAAEMPGVAAADLTGVHAELLKSKSYSDMTGNNVNHPNDYLSRWHAQFLFGMLARRGRD